MIAAMDITFEIIARRDGNEVVLGTITRTVTLAGGPAADEIRLSLAEG